MNNGFLKIYDEYYDSIYRYVYVRVRSSWDTDDIVGETFRKAYERYGSINSNARAWLFSIARNCICDFYRRNKHKTVQLEEVFDREESLLEESLIHKDELDCLKKSLEALEEEELDLISLRYFSNLKYEEIVRIVGRQNDYLRVKASRTIKKLGNMMTKCMEES